jgi:hypothetical protein
MKFVPSEVRSCTGDELKEEYLRASVGTSDSVTSARKILTMLLTHAEGYALGLLSKRCSIRLSYVPHRSLREELSVCLELLHNIKW